MKVEFGFAARLLTAAAIAFGVAATGGPALADQEIEVTIDFAKLVKLDTRPDTVVIGNSGISDAVLDKTLSTIVLTGKAAGVTNLIVLDDEGGEAERFIVRVSSDTRELTTVFRGNQRQTFSCAPVCEQVISVGDEQRAFETAKTQIEGRQQFSDQ